MPDPSAPSEDLRVASVIVLAAGSGTRMNSRTAKVLHPLAGKPLLWHAVEAASEVDPDELIVVVGYGRDQVGDYLTRAHPHVRQVVQADQLGTGHAVQCALDGTAAPDGIVLVTYGDVPLLTGATLRALTHAHAQAGNAVTVLTAQVDDPTGYGRIVRNAAGGLAAIVEHRDATVEQRMITEINSGVYAFDGAVLAAALPRLDAVNHQGERYLTDVVALATEDGAAVGTLQAPDAAETEGVNDRVQLADLAARLNHRLVRAAQLAGVTIQDPSSTWLHADVTIGADTVLLPGTSLEAGTVVGRECVIGPQTTLSDCRVADGASVVRSQCTGARIGPGAQVGPFSFLRPGTELAGHAKVGAFVEVKNSTVGRNSKVPHLSYIGDTTIGTGSNIGAGTITANYDGVVKSPTVIGHHVFIGTDSTLVAPVTVGDGAYVAAGSTITGDVQPGDLAIARGRQQAIPGWVASRRPGSASDVAAQSAGDGAGDNAVQSAGAGDNAVQSAGHSAGAGDSAVRNAGGEPPADLPTGEDLSS